MEIIVKDCSDHPSCPHGPCLMFERKTVKKSGKRFYACSATRSRSICNFFHYVDDKFGPHKQEAWEQIIKDSKPKLTHEQYMKQLSSFLKLPAHQRKFCQSCSELVIKKPQTHNNHSLLSDLSNEQLLQPSILISHKEENKAEAQYFFSRKDVQFLTTLFQKLNYNKVVCIGTPKIHEYIKLNEKELGLKSVLLDIDARYMQFFHSKQFFHYNMFNNHFFSGDSSKELFKQFLKEEDGDKTVIIIDPPFGGLIGPLAFTLMEINQWWQGVNNKGDSEILSMIWTFPYFFEARIIKSIPSLNMSDYKVQYSNHLKFGKRAGNKRSPVRFFTNIPGSLFTLPESDGYKYCETCIRWVSQENKHCSICNKCTTKHGDTYKHCDICRQCVKSKYEHCREHNMCSPHTITNHCSCIPEKEGDEERCFTCHGIGHRKRDCPENFGNPKKKQKMAKMTKKPKGVKRK